MGRWLSHRGLLCIIEGLSEPGRLVGPALPVPYVTSISPQRAEQSPSLCGPSRPATGFVANEMGRQGFHFISAVSVQGDGEEGGRGGGEGLPAILVLSLPQTVCPSSVMEASFGWAALGGWLCSG